MATSRGLLALATAERLRDTARPETEPGPGQGSVPGNVTPWAAPARGNQSSAFPGSGEARRAGAGRQQSARARDPAALGMVGTPLLPGPAQLCGRLCLPGACEAVRGDRHLEGKIEMKCVVHILSLHRVLFLLPCLLCWGAVGRLAGGRFLAFLAHRGRESNLLEWAAPPSGCLRWSGRVTPSLCSLAFPRKGLFCSRGSPE